MLMGNSFELPIFCLIFRGATVSAHFFLLALLMSIFFKRYYFYIKYR